MNRCRRDHAETKLFDHDHLTPEITDSEIFTARTIVMTAVAAVEFLCKADGLGDSGPSLSYTAFQFEFKTSIAVHLRDVLRCSEWYRRKTDTEHLCVSERAHRSILERLQNCHKTAG